MMEDQKREYSDEIQKLYIQFLLASEETFARCQNIIKTRYFSNKFRPVIRFIQKYTEDYKAMPTNEQVFAETGHEFPKLEGAIDRRHIDWFLTEFETFCRHRSMESVILDAPEKLEKGYYDEVYQQMKDSILISLQKDLGTDYFSNTMERLKKMMDKEGVVSTGWNNLDKKLFGGFSKGGLNIFAAGSGCVVAETTVRAIRLLDISTISNRESEIKIKYSENEYNYLLQFYNTSQIEQYCHGSDKKLKELYDYSQPIITSIYSLGDVNEGKTYLVDSPDGWVPVIGWVEKYKTELFKIKLENGLEAESSDDHLFQNKNQEWIFARDLKINDLLLVKDGFSKIVEITKTTSNKVYDLSVDHVNHRYYTNDISSHNTGKSLILQNISLNWIQKKLNVVYITLELSEMLTGFRFDSMISEIPTNQIFKNLDQVELRVAMNSKKWGKLQIKYLGAGSTTNDIKAYLKEYEIQTGVRPDAIVIDYLDLLSPNSKKVNPSDLFVKDKYVSEELRSLANELNCLLVTASQLNRSSAEELEHTHAHIAGGISKINTADNVITLYATDSMRERGELRLQFLKTRNSNGVGSKIFMKVDTSTLRILDVEEGDNMGISSSSSVNKITDDLKLKRESNRNHENLETQDSTLQLKKLISRMSQEN